MCSKWCNVKWLNRKHRTATYFPQYFHRAWIHHHQTQLLTSIYSLNILKHFEVKKGRVFDQNIEGQNIKTKWRSGSSSILDHFLNIGLSTVHFIWIKGSTNITSTQLQTLILYTSVFIKMYYRCWRRHSSWLRRKKCKDEFYPGPFSSIGKSDTCVLTEDMVCILECTVTH
jgi:hypothetical protein